MYFKMKAILVAVLIFSITLLNLIKADNEISIWERRKLKQFPEIKVEALVSGKWFMDFESYALDQIVFRHELRKLKVCFEGSVLGKQDVSGLFSEKKHIFKMIDYKDVAELQRFVAYVENLKDSYFHDNNIYYVHIPDKTSYSDREQLVRLESATEAYLKENLLGLSFISISNKMTLENFYETDTHWRQETLHPIVKGILEGMGMEMQYEEKDFIKKAQPSFLGVLYGQLPNHREHEALFYLEHPDFQSYRVYDYEKGFIGMYEESKLSGMEPYDVFLSGASPILEINNPHAQTDKELVIFRDSFGSSIIPLLSFNYAKIIAVDTRYVTTSYLSEVVDFSKDQDVLFLYSSGIVHNFEVLR
jgi:ribosomal protein S18